MNAYDYLIVGAGLFGATCARLLTEAGQRVLVLERRKHTAGNCYDIMVNNIPVGQYGGHIFHTNSKRIWDYANRFAEWRFYEHRVKANYRGKVYSLPPNLTTFDQIGMMPGPEAEAKIREMFFAGYTEKQWGRPIEQVPASVLARIPIRYNYDDRYFSDRYQGVPEFGYAAWIEKMLKGIPIELEVDFLQNKDYWREKAGRVIYSGALDEYFNYDQGKLEYRSLEFRHKIVEVPDYQGCATVNYTDRRVDYTRVIEWQHFGWRGGKNVVTPIMFEYPRATGEPYYPIDDERNRGLHNEYAKAAREIPGFYFGGRLGNYQYYNMDQVIGQAMHLVERLGSE